MLQDVLRSLDASPRSLVGVSFSSTSMRYVHFVEHESTYRVSGYAQVKIPFDVMKGSEVEHAVEFTDMLKKYFDGLDRNTRIFIKDDGDEIKAQSFALLGFKDIRLSPLPESLISIAVPYGIYTQRLLIFASWDRATLLLIDGPNCKKVGTIDTSINPECLPLVITDALSGIENKHVLYAGIFEDDFRKLIEEKVTLEEASLFQNIIDITEHIPEIPRAQMHRYTVPIALVSYGIHYEVPRVVVDVSDDQEQDTQVEASDFFKGIEPMTKLEEDKRRASESVRGYKYKKLMKSTI